MEITAHRKALLRSGAVLALILTVLTAGASTFQPIALSELPRRTEAQILGRVTDVRAADKDEDEVTIEVASVLQGKAPADVMTLRLTPRGPKGFDPTLKPGDTGVFFLKSYGGRTYLSYHEGVALFPHPHAFKPAEKQPVPQKTAPGVESL